MTTLPRTPTARLRFVADILEAHPARHEQVLWWIDSVNHPDDSFDYPTEDVVGAAGDPIDCGTKGCVAGWAVASTPSAEYKRLVSDNLDISRFYDCGQEIVNWEDAGRAVLGLPNMTVASFLFYADNERAELIEALRWLADVPKRDRTVKNLADAGILISETADEFL